MALRLIAILWGFAEATVFFIVPDVFTSRVALTQGSAAAYRSCAWAVLGALLGGTLLFFTARQNPSAASWLLGAFDFLPGISPALIESARLETVAHGSAACFTSSAAGIPYKVCTVQAALGGVSFPAFLLMSLLARALRFALVTSIAVICQRLLLHRVPATTRTRIHLIVWSLFYAWYFWVMSA
ncbi:MAG: hypothetical protein QM760_22475 [Nibricoccus sp.]